METFRQPSQKDLTGWRGPCVVVSTHDIESGHIDVKWQGRTMSARVPDIRRSILFIGLTDSGDVPIQLLRRHLLSLSSPSVQVLSWVETPGGWQLSKAASQYGDVFSALRHCGKNVFGLKSCFGGRLGRGPTHLAGVANVARTVVVWWPASQPGLYHTFEAPGEQRIDLRTLFPQDEDICWVQFLEGTNNSVKRIRLKVPEDPYLQPPNRPQSNRTTPVSSHAMSDDDERMLDPHPPYYPPPPPPYRAPMPVAPAQIPVPTGSSWAPTPMSTRQGSVRSQVPSEAPPLPRPFLSPAPSTRSSLAPTVVTPPQNKRPTNSTHKQGPPTKSQALNPSSSASSSWQQPSQLPVHIPLLPYDDSEDESLASTIIAEDEATFAIWDFIADDISSPAMCSECCFEQSEEYKPMGKLGNTCWWLDLSRPLKPDEFCVYDIITSSKVIEKSLDELTAAEVKANPTLIAEAIRKELGSFITHKCFEPIQKGKMKNVLTSRWLFKWKVIDGVRTVKARLVVHGFKDHAVSSLITYANTTTRWGQRIVNSVAAQQGWELLSADVGTAFLQGLTFVQLAELTGEPLREVGLVPPKGYEQYFQALPGLEQFNVTLFDLFMTKPIYGLCDAPRAWRKRLDQILVSLGGRALRVDSAIYVWHSNNVLCGIASTHVDDLKLAGVKAFVTKLLASLTATLGPLKTQTAFMSSFEHCGIMHSQDENYAVTIHQDHYCVQLRPANVADIDVSRPLVVLTSIQIAVFLSLLGALSWLSQTRADIMVYVQSLQRNAKHPLVEHLLRLNKITKWVKRKPCSILYQRLQSPVKVLAISDSAFRKEDRTGLAMRGAIVCVAEQCLAMPLTPSGRIHPIEFFSRKQRRICRSTYSAELHGLIDAIETARLVAYAYTEILTAESISPSAMVTKDESGLLVFDIEAAIDARSIFDSLVPADTRAPTEGSLIFVLLQIKELLKCGTLRRLFWVNTHDQLADALTKGCIARSAIITAFRLGVWRTQHECFSHTETVNVSVKSARADVAQHMTDLSRPDDYD